MEDGHRGDRAALRCTGGARPARWHLLHVTTEDVDAEVAAVRARGGVIAAEPDDLPWGPSAYVAGPNNVMVEIYQA